MEGWGPHSSAGRPCNTLDCGIRPPLSSAAPLIFSSVSTENKTNISHCSWEREQRGRLPDSSEWAGPRWLSSSAWRLPKDSPVYHHPLPSELLHNLPFQSELKQSPTCFLYPHPTPLYIYVLTSVFFPFPV